MTDNQAYESLVRSFGLVQRRNTFIVNKGDERYLAKPCWGYTALIDMEKVDEGDKHGRFESSFDELSIPVVYPTFAAWREAME